MAVTVTNTQRKVRLPARRLREAATSALSRLGLRNTELGILITGDRKMRALNRAYRGIDRTTDVLSFSMSGAVPGGIPEGEGGPPALLGDVVISAPRALVQAGERGHSVEDEAVFLLVHGILHLAGYDHEGTPEDRRKMERMHRSVMMAVKGR